MEFYQTPRGAAFFDHQLPQLIKALNKLAESLTLKQAQSQTKNPNISDKTAERLREVMADTEKCTEFGGAFIRQIMSDDEKQNRLGHRLAKAILENNTEDLLIAVCGWSSESLLDIADNHVAQMSEEGQNEITEQTL